MSFGMEDVDRYIVVYKKEYSPSEDEICARRDGEEWNAETAKKYIQKVGTRFKRIDYNKCLSYEFCLRQFLFTTFSEGRN